ncbi:MAG: hypothetical protein PVG06_20595 [Desulfobacterales bacterium]|jgi:maltose 6'-phosphate phosphatase
MKTSDYLKCAILLCVFLFAACQCKPPIIGDAQCDNIAKKGYVSILVLNVDYEVVNHEKNLKRIANFVANNHVDLILFQEAEAYGGITGPADATSELRKILLKKYKMRFNMTSAADILIWGNAILSSCEITETDLKKINTPGTVGKGAIGLNRNVLLAVISIPDYGKVNVYNTHLCARCEKSEREVQLDRALSWIKEITPDSRLAIFGGDLNFDLFINNGAEVPMYKKIIKAGLKDAYADYMKTNGVGLDDLCEDEDKPDEHCTKGVTRIDDKNGRRVDYIFIKSPPGIKSAKVVFNSVVSHTEPTVSDHAGVFIRLNLH